VHRGRISQAALRELNDLYGDKRCYRVSALRQSKGVTCCRKCHTHRVDQFRVERLSLQKGRDWHYALNYLLAEMVALGSVISLGREIADPLGQFVAARQEQPAPLHVQKVRFQRWTGLRGRGLRWP